MPSTRRRIVRRVVCAVAVVVLLLNGYVSAWIALPWAIYRYNVTWEALDAIEPAFAPIEWYCDSDYPGGQSLRSWSVKQQWRAVAAAVEDRRDARANSRN